jgi:hypothetical protein
MHFTRTFGRILVIAAGLMLVASGQWAHATPIHYITSGTGSGVLGATPFTNQPFTVTIAADTAGVQTVVAGLSVGVNNQSVQVQVGATTANGSVNGSSYGLASTINTAGFGYSELSLAQALDIDTFNFALEISSIPSYGLGPIGPLSVTQNGGFFGFQTSAGFLNLSSTSGLTFQAILIPEPSMLAPLCIAGVAQRRKTKKRNQSSTARRSH